MQKDNATQTLIQFVEALKIPITRKSISDELQKHPDLHSLLAFNDVLNNWHVPNDAYKVPFDDLKDVPLPFIVFMADKQFAVVTRLDEDEFTISNDRFKNKVLTAEQFKRSYKGSVLVAEKSAASGEADYSRKRRDEFIESLRMPVGITGLAAILLQAFLYYSGYIHTLNLPISLLTLFKTTGLVTSVLLLAQSIDTNNPLIQRLCGGDDHKNCNAILSSKAARVIKRLSWSEIGFFYFAGTWLVLLFGAGRPAILQALALFNLLALPYTVYSIYYQWKIARQWCTLCCTVQALLWLEFFSFLPFLLQPIRLPAAIEWLGLVALMLLPVLVWIIIKPTLLQLQKVAPLTEQLRKFKYSKELFDAALKEQPKYAVPSDEWSIVLGNVEANGVITMVSNPYCQPCAQAHEQIEDALNNSENVQVRVVFVGNNTHENDSKTRVHRHLMALNALPDKSIIKNALKDWYAQKQKDYEAWAKAYPVTITGDNNAKLEKQKAWVDTAEIKGTPTLLVNGYRLPRQVYQVHELKYMLD